MREILLATLAVTVITIGAYYSLGAMGFSEEERQSGQSAVRLN